MTDKRTVFTPGPWEVATPKQTNNEKLIITGRDPEGSRYQPIATIENGNANALHLVIGPTEQKANARLMAAAPELLAALELACATIERLDARAKAPSAQGTLDVARAAIGKARG